MTKDEKPEQKKIKINPIEYAMFCDHASLTVDGKLNMNGIFERIMVVGDHVVAVEKDTFETPAGDKTTTTLGVYHMQDGKIWRAYSFPINEDAA